MKKLQKATDETFLMIESHEAETEEEISVPANATVKGTVSINIKFQQYIISDAYIRKWLVEDFVSRRRRTRSTRENAKI